jgi:hypothetical protein
MDGCAFGWKNALKSQAVFKSILNSDIAFWQGYIGI